MKFQQRKIPASEKNVIKGFKVALVHEMIIKMGGAERVLKVLEELFPQSVIKTSIFDKKKCSQFFDQKKIETSFLQKFYQAKIPLNILRMYMLRAFESFDFSSYDLVISSSSAFSHAILTNTHTKHLCYCHSPARFLWDFYFPILSRENHGFIKKIKKSIFKAFAYKARIKDVAAAQRSDQIIANSQNVQKRINKFWRRSCKVIYPPVEIDEFTLSQKNENYFLIVSALQPFKRIDIAIKAFAKIPKHRLIIIGEGSAQKIWQKNATSNVEFLGRKSDQTVREYLKNCRAFIFTSDDDFGIAPLEAAACGKPTIAFKSGGALETIIENQTGIFFNQQTSESLLNGLLKFFEQENNFNPQKIRKQAEKFSKENFKNNFLQEVKNLINL